MNLPAALFHGDSPTVLSVWLAAQVAVVSLAAIAVAACFRRNAAVRHAVLLCGLFGVAATPLFLLFDSPWRIEVVSHAKRRAHEPPPVSRFGRAPEWRPAVDDTRTGQDFADSPGSVANPFPSRSILARLPSDAGSPPGPVIRTPRIHGPTLTPRVASRGKLPPVRAPRPGRRRPARQKSAAGRRLVASSPDPVTSSSPQDRPDVADPHDVSNALTTTPSPAFVVPPGWIAIGWFAGVLLCSIRLLRSYRLLRTVIRNAGEVSRPDRRSLLSETCRELSIHRPPRLLVSERVRSPISAGILRPVVLLPAAILSSLSRAELRQVLLHELAHIRRRDHLALLLQRLVQSLFWPHLCVHWLATQLGDAREEVCDNVVLSAIDPTDYSRTLLSLAERLLQPHCPSAATGLFPRRCRLRHRIASLVDERRTVMERLKLRSTLLIAVPMLGLTAGIGMLQYRSARADDSKPATNSAAVDPSTVTKAKPAAASNAPASPLRLNVSQPEPASRPAKPASRRPAVPRDPAAVRKAAIESLRDNSGLNKPPGGIGSRNYVRPRAGGGPMIENRRGRNTTSALRGLADPSSGGVGIVGLIEALSSARLKVQTLEPELQRKRRLAQRGYTSSQELEVLKRQHDEAQRRFELLYELTKLALEGAKDEYTALRIERNAGGKVSARDVAAVRCRMRQLQLVLKHFKPSATKKTTEGGSSRGGSDLDSSGLSPSGSYRAPSRRSRTVGSADGIGTGVESRNPTVNRADTGAASIQRPALELKSLGKISRITGNRRKLVLQVVLAVLKFQDAARKQQMLDGSGLSRKSDDPRLWTKFKSSHDYLLVTYRSSRNALLRDGTEGILIAFPPGEAPRMMVKYVHGARTGQARRLFNYGKLKNVAALKQLLSLPELALVGRLPAKKGNDSDELKTPSRN